MKNYYQILGIEPNATPDEIKKAYRKLSLKFHPDKNPDDKYFETRFKEINEAYSILGNSQKKEVYDSELKEFDFINSDLKNAHDFLKQEAEKLKAEREKFEREKAKVKPSPKAENPTYQKPPIVSDDNENVEESKSLMPVFVTVLLLMLIGAMIYSNSGTSRFDNEATEEALPAVDSAMAFVDSAVVSGVDDHIEVDNAAIVVDSAVDPVDFSGQFAFMKGDGTSELIEAINKPLVNNDKYFTIGSSMDEVLEIYGKPYKVDTLADNIQSWTYVRWENKTKRLPTVLFENGKVFAFTPNW